MKKINKKIDRKNLNFGNKTAILKNLETRVTSVVFENMFLYFIKLFARNGFGGFVLW